MLFHAMMVVRRKAEKQVSITIKLVNGLNVRCFLHPSLKYSAVMAYQGYGQAPGYGPPQVCVMCCTTLVQWY